MSKIILNQAQCLACEEIITSLHRHDFQKCKCGKSAVDGGRRYLRRVGGPMLEMSEYFDEPLTDSCSS